MNNEITAQNILDEIAYATIATTNSDGEPWNTPVFCAHDGYTIYWSSHSGSVHSRNIAANNKAFIAIYNSKAGQGEGVGVYMKATVRILEEQEEITHALNLLGERRSRPFKHIEKFIDDGPQRVYEARPIKIWTNDAHQDNDGDFIEDFRVEVTVN